MVAESLAEFDGSDLCLAVGNNCSTYPHHSLPAALRAALAEDAVRIVEFAKAHPKVLTKPYGYRIFTDGGNPRKLRDWRERNVLANKMLHLGFEKFEHELSSAFSDCIYQARRLGNFEDSREWAFGLALSSAAIFTIHVMNIYQPQKGLLTNILDANLQHDALDRPNYKPAIAAISKVVRKTLGWKGDAEQRDEFRAEMIISLIEFERGTVANVRKANRGIDFEKRCLALLSAAEFGDRETRTSGDFGADLIAEIDDLLFAIQCKDLSKPVGVKAVQEAIGARRYYKVDFACVCADSGFTDAALELAATNKVITTSSANLVRSLMNAV